MQFLDNQPAGTDRLPPSSTEAEICLLASLMLESTGAAARECAATIPPEAFYLADHLFIYEAIQRLATANRGIDAVTVRAVLEKSGRLAEIGGTEYLARILGTVPVWQHWREYSEIVAEKHRQRQILTACLDAMRQVYAREASAHDIIATTNAKLASAATIGNTATTRPIAEIIEQFGRDRANGATNAIATGFANLDEEHFGLIALGEMTLVAGRPGMGKSTLIRQLALNVAQSGVVVGFISLEESENKIAGNYVSNICTINNQYLANAILTDRDFQAIESTAAVLSDTPLYFARSHSALNKILAVAETLITQRKAQVIVIDHLHEISLPHLEGEAKVREIAHAVAQLTKTRNVAGLYACQLNRANEMREDRLPTLSDLRQSGALEEKADNVLLLHRADYYHKTTPGYQPTHILQTIIAKKRNGAPGMKALHCDMVHQKITDYIEHAHHDPFAR